MRFTFSHDAEMQKMNENCIFHTRIIQLTTESYDIWIIPIGKVCNPAHNTYQTWQVLINYQISNIKTNNSKSTLSASHNHVFN